jgi:RimJ/RimL family protein N-acetyltransferase
MLAADPLSDPLRGRLVRLRPFEPNDPAELNPLFVETGVLDGIGMAFPQSVEGFRSFVETQRRRDDAVTLAIEDLADRRAVGTCALFDIEPAHRKAMFGIWIVGPSQGRGLGTDATRTMVRYGFREMNLQRIELRVFGSNPGARRVYERVGFRLEGTLRRGHFAGGAYVDEHVMGLLDDEFVEEPPSPA